MTPPLDSLVLSPVVQRYAWGDPEILPHLLGESPDGLPWAEAWYGAHPYAPSVVRFGEEDEPLDHLLARASGEILGYRVQARFGGLPYLLKIIAARKPLSIQVHPSLTQAQAGFEREALEKIPFDAPHRSYRDANHKPEVLVALTPVDALCGFRSPPEIAGALAALPEIRALLPAFVPDDGGVRALLGAYFALPAEPLAAAWGRVLARLEATSPGEQDPAFWALRAHRELSDGGPPDRGLLFVFLLALLRLEPGQGIFLPAGVPHAYLRGAGVELMASSDNVLRAGLTPKHIAPEELLRTVRFDARAPVLLAAAWTEDGSEGVYPTPVAEFELSRLRLGNAPIARVAHGPELLLALPDDASTVVRVSHGGTPVPLRRGQAFLVPDGMSYQIAADGPGSVFRAVVPGGAPAGEFRGRRPACLAFGTSGLRGLVTDITDLEAYINTRGFLDFLVASGDAAPGSTIALAGDLRPSTDSPDRSILRAVACAIRDAGMEPLYFGRIPTPALMAHGLRQGWPSVMVTGSHIPFDRNGIKFNKSSGEVLKEDEGPILEAVERVRRREYARAREGSLFDDGGWLREGHRAPLPPLQDEARRGYLRRYLDAFPAGALAGLRVAFYEHSAVGREVVVEILRGLGAEVFPVGRSEQFVAIDTEAISAEQLALLQALADDLREKIGPFDAIVSTDGDSDRPMLLGIDEGGRVRFLGGDVLGTLVADALGADAIAVPISASDLIDLHFTPKNIPVTRTRIGSPWVIAAMATLDGARRVGWEANGGFLTGSTLALPAGPLAPLPTRDAVLPLVTALHAARRAGGSLVDLLATLPRRFSQSGLLDQVDPARSRALLARLAPGHAAIQAVHFSANEVRILDARGNESPAGDATPRLLEVRAELQRHFSHARGFGPIEGLNYLDGVRIQFAGGDVAHVRPSGNAPQLRIYAVASTEERAEEIVAQGLAEPHGLLRSLLGG